MVKFWNVTVMGGLALELGLAHLLIAGNDTVPTSLWRG